MHLLVTRVGLTSFGGGVSAWMMRLVVEERGMDDARPNSSPVLRFVRSFPGINVLNLSIWLGYRLHGGAGALVGALAMIVPPGLILIGLGIGFGHLAGSPSIGAALTGVAAAGVGLTGAMGVRATRRAARGVVPAALIPATFIAIAVLHWPLVPVVAGFGVVSVGLAWRAG